MLADESRALQEAKRLDYDSEGQLAENQMGIFKYLRDRLSGGVVKLNERMRILSMLVGDAFTYATVAHESQHSLDRSAGRLTPEQEIAGEINAFRTQYLWLELMDPTGERMLTLWVPLKRRFAIEKDPEIKHALGDAITYLEHLSDVRTTGGKDDKLKKLVEKLGYTDGHKHEADGHRGAGSPSSA